MSGPKLDIRAIKEKASPELFKIEGVVGVGTDGVSKVIVYTLDDTVEARLPKTYDGATVEVVVTGKILVQ